MTSRSFIGFNFENRSKIDRFMTLNLGPDLRLGYVHSLSIIYVTARFFYYVTAQFFYKKVL